MQNSVRVDRDVPLKMRDGTLLRADVFRPDDNTKHPAIVVRTPYNKQLAVSSWDFLPAIDAAFAGYAMVIQDTRGRFASEGKYIPFQNEGPDGYDTIEAIAAESWCDGNVGMMGLSALAGVQWAAASQEPPHLKAIAPSMVPQSLYEEEFYTGGAFHLDLAATWFPGMALDTLNKLKQQGKDTAEMRPLVHSAILHPEEVYDYLPLKELPFLKFKELSTVYYELLEGPTSDSELWKRILAQPPDEKYHVPALQVGGWYDLFTKSLFSIFNAMRERAGSQHARESQHILCGPWTHRATLPRAIGAINFGPQAAGLTAFVPQYHLRFFDRYLRGMDVELPAIRYFVMGANVWRNADGWPLPGTQWQRYFFHSKGHANTDHRDGLLSRDEPGSEPPDIFVYNPHFPTPTTGGRNLEAGRLVAGPIDQSVTEQRHDVLCYTTPALDEDIEITGPLTLHLFASTSARDTDFTAKLIEVYPNSMAYNVAEGIIRARYRNSITKPELVTPGEVNEYRIDMAATSNVFRKGHRIRIDISSSNFPRFDRNMNTGNPLGEDTQGLPAMQTIYHQSEYASYIDFPIIPPPE